MKTNLANIGVVTYCLHEESGQLHARWYHSDLDSGKLGTGLATPSKANGFEGYFNITYYLDGETIGMFNLSITRIVDTYHLEWLNGESIVYVGIGILEAGTLCAGWRTVQTNSKEEADL